MKKTMVIDSVQLRFGENVVLQSAYVTASSGMVTGVLGRNGTGKSCLFKCIMGGIRPQNKYIRLNDDPKTDYGHIGLKVKYLPQEHFIPRGMKLIKAFEMYGVDFEELVKFDAKFDSYRDYKIRQLSGGEQRIVEVFLILNAESDICILDEPFSNILPIYDERIRQMIREQKNRKGIIITDHLYEQILDVVDDLYLICDGFTHLIHSREDLVRLGYIKN